MLRKIPQYSTLGGSIRRNVSRIRPVKAHPRPKNIPALRGQLAPEYPITRENVETYGKGSSQTTIPGLEVSGVIEEIGAEVTDKKVGDKVCALMPDGGYAEYVAVDSLHCLLLPKGIYLQ